MTNTTNNTDAVQNPMEKTMTNEIELETLPPVAVKQSGLTQDYEIGSGGAPPKGGTTDHKDGNCAGEMSTRDGGSA